jgi:hypothetical protein
MIEVRHDVYAEGAAIAHGASIEIADLVSPSARDRFKRAFHETLISWLIHSNQENRNWARRMIEIVTACLERGATPEETKDEIEKVARRLGCL